MEASKSTTQKVDYAFARARLQYILCRLGLEQHSDALQKAGICSDEDLSYQSVHHLPPELSAHVKVELMKGVRWVEQRKTELDRDEVRQAASVELLH